MFLFGIAKHHRPMLTIWNDKTYSIGMRLAKRNAGICDNM
jgi:hypothetical protein